MGNRSDKDVKAAAPAPQGLLEAARKAGQRGLPPVHLWNPPFCGDLDMEIRADGSWFYQGTPIGRPEMVRLFSTILKREGDAYFLVTPVEKVGIRVVDAPFLAVDCDITAEGVALTTNVGDRVVMGPDHPLILRGTAETPRPYLHIRAGLEALIDRKSFYRLADAASPGPDGRMGLTSQGQFFALEL